MWAILDVFDPDSLHGLQLNALDLEQLAPELYQARFEEVQEAFAGTALDDVEDVVRELGTRRIGPAQFDVGFQKLVLERVAPLAGDHGVQTLEYDASASPPWPLVDAEHLRPLPAEIRRHTGWTDDDLALIAAANHGELTDALAQRLRDRGVELKEVSGADQWISALHPELEAPLRQLAGLGLAKHFWPGEPIRGLVICVGDAAWDCAFALALDRMGIDARWVPARATADNDALVALAEFARWIWQHRKAPVEICSTSSDTDAETLAATLTDLLGPDIEVRTASPTELLPTRAGRLFERENAGSQQVTVSVHNGLTPVIQTPLPKLVTSQSVHHLRWMTEIDADVWKGLRHHRLADLVIDRLPITDGTIRAGRDGLAYVCPTVMTRDHLTLEGQTVKPRLKPLSMLEQIQGLLGIYGWDASPSDKGIYLRGASAIFGGDRQLAEALEDERGRLLTVFLARKEETPPGWLIGERRYLTLQQLREASGLNAGAEELILDLEDAGALVRGLALKCTSCRNERFYRLADAGERFQCSRCWAWQPVNQATLQISAEHAEPTWLYGLAEVLVQFLTNNGDIPLLNSYGFMRSRAGLSQVLGQRQIELVGELDVKEDDGTKHELDIAIALDSELWLGEATADRKLGKSEAAQRGRLQELSRTAKLLNARGVMLITAADEWNDNTKRLAREVFPGVWPLLELREGAQRVNRWTPAPPSPAAMVVSDAGKPTPGGAGS